MFVLPALVNDWKVIVFQHEKEKQLKKMIKTFKDSLEERFYEE